MRTPSASVWLCCGVLVGGLVSFAGRASADSRIALDVILREATSSRFALEVKLTNLGPDALAMYEEELPWGNRYSMSISAMAWDGKQGVPLAEVFKIDDSLYTPVTIALGQSLEGNIIVNPRFPRLTDTLDRIDVILFWSYRLRIKGKYTGQLFQGAMLLPRHKP